jgi:hypothetical protein
MSEPVPRLPVLAGQTVLTGHGQEPTALGENGIPRQLGTAAPAAASLDWLSLHGRRLPFAPRRISIHLAAAARHVQLWLAARSLTPLFRFVNQISKLSAFSEHPPGGFCVGVVNRQTRNIAVFSKFY